MCFGVVVDLASRSEALDLLLLRYGIDSPCARRSDMMLIEQSMPVCRDYGDPIAFLTSRRPRQPRLGCKAEAVSQNLCDPSSARLRSGGCLRRVPQSRIPKDDTKFLTMAHARAAVVLWWQAESVVVRVGVLCVRDAVWRASHRAWSLSKAGGGTRSLGGELYGRTMVQKRGCYRARKGG